MLRSLVILAAACFLTATAAAQPAPDPSAPLPPASSRQCSDLPRDKDITRDDVAFAQACQETLRLQQENLRLQVETDRLKAETESIKLNNSNRIWSVLAALGPLFGAVIALIPV